jgi:hypothetical protein
LMQVKLQQSSGCPHPNPSGWHSPELHTPFVHSALQQVAADTHGTPAGEQIGPPPSPPAPPAPPPPEGPSSSARPPHPRATNDNTTRTNDRE